LTKTAKCGSTTSEIIRFRLYEYQFDDLEFLHERQENQMDEQCGSMRKCQDGNFSKSDDPWKWSANRVMTPRLAFRMRRLAIIANGILELQGLAIVCSCFFPFNHYNVVVLDSRLSDSTLIRMKICFRIKNYCRESFR
jgi:hypothetical protein